MTRTASAKSARAEAFAEWLVDEAYSPGTQHQSVASIRALERQYDQTGAIPQQALREVSTLRRYALYLADRPPQAPSAFDQLVAAEISPLQGRVADSSARSKQRARAAGKGKRALGAAPTHAGGRKLVAQSIPEEHWQRLVAHLERDKSREATVLLVMTAVGARIGDVLRLTRADLERAKRVGVIELHVKGGRLLEVPMGGVPEIWTRLSRHFQVGPDDNLALWVTVGTNADPEGAAAAYKRCSRHLQRVGTLLGIPGRLHLHRLRRTVAVRALGITRDVHAVQQLLGHRSLSSTLRYVDELRRADVEKLQRDLRGTR
jgi:integrase